MSTLYNGLLAGNMIVGNVLELVASRQNFALAHATEAIKLSFFRKQLKGTFTGRKETGINGKQYVDLYNYKVSAPDFLVTPKRIRAYYILFKEPNNLRAKIGFRDAHTEYLNLVNDASVDPTVPTGASLAGGQLKVKVSNSESYIEPTWTAGVTPLQAQWIGTNSGSASTGGAQTTGTLMPALTNARADRQISGIQRMIIGTGTTFGAAGDVGELTSENCSFDLEGLVPGDRKSYSDLEFQGSMKINTVIETMQSSLTKEIQQAIIDEGGEPPGQILFQSGMILKWDAGALTIDPDWEFGDQTGHMKLNINGEVQFNTSETTPDFFDCGITTPNIIWIKAQS